MFLRLQKVYLLRNFNNKQKLETTPLLLSQIRTELHFFFFVFQLVNKTREVTVTR